VGASFSSSLPVSMIDDLLARRFCTKTFSGHNDWVRSVIPSSDGQQLISCSVDQVRSPLPLLPSAALTLTFRRRPLEYGKQQKARRRRNFEGTITSLRLLFSHR
jgi:WD40 repeat protein